MSRRTPSRSPLSSTGPACWTASAAVVHSSGYLTGTPAATNATKYAKIVHELSLLRRLIHVGTDIAEVGYSQPDDVVKAIDSAETMVFNLSQGRAADTLSPIRDLLDANLDRLEQLYEQGDSITGTPTGFVDLDESACEIDLRDAFNDGIRAVAVCLVHGFRFTDHEVRIGEIARHIGFEQVSISHDVEALVKFVSRGETPVVVQSGSGSATAGGSITFTRRPSAS